LASYLSSSLLSTTSCATTNNLAEYLFVTPTTAVEAPGQELGRVLEEARQEAGLTFKALERALWKMLGDDAPTAEAIRAWHRGAVSPETGSIAMAAAFAAVYDKRLSELSPVLAVRYERLFDLLKRQKPCLAA